ncbi:MAG: hypothetical protein J7M08_08005 [Planctomycetes bacterium]|nr:hypothetical protein [Planctomycetota bacterium]
MVVVPLILGGVLELVQPLVGRLCSAGDMLANGAGVATVAGAICFSRLLSMRRVDAQRV